MDRRKFIKSCTVIGAMSTINPGFFNQLFAQETNLVKKYNKALLIKEDGTPLKEEDIKPYNYYLFFYPFVSTPCYLINLDKEVPPCDVKLSDGSIYKFKGGVGLKKNIVAYSAICSHQWSYPTKDYAFINYYSPEQKSQTTNRSNVIQCCAHLSVFDPSQGGIVLEGPAPLPLANIILTFEDGKFYAEGVLGKDQFEEFFDNYKSDLREQYGTTKKAKSLVETATVMEVGKYVKEQIKC